MDLAPLKIERSRTVAAAPRGRGRIPWTALVVLALVGLSAWIFHRPVLAFVDRMRLPEVTVARAARSTELTASTAIGTSANGFVVASTRAALSADTPGRIVEMNVQEGDAVKKGFVVARLYSDEYRAALQRAEADLAAQDLAVNRAGEELTVARSEVTRLSAARDAAAAVVDEAKAMLGLARLKLERAKRMVADDVESRQWLDDALAEHERSAAAERSAQAHLAAAEAAVVQGGQRVDLQAAALAEAGARIPVLAAVRDQAQATLDKTEVRAPFDGIVVLKDAEVGEVVSPNSQGGNSRGSVATMVDFQTLEVQVEMPERSIAAVRAGSAVKIFLDAWPEAPYAGRVTRIWPVANRQKATVEVRASFDQPDEKLRPEMGARVVFLDEGVAAATAASGAPSGVLVPASAIVVLDGRSCVFVVERDSVRVVEVTAGEEKQGRVLVTRGLEGQERVVLDPPAELHDGDRVRLRQDA